jgi:hypothetical protein
VRLDQRKGLVGAHLLVPGRRDLEVDPDGEDVAGAAGFEHLAQFAAAPVDLVARGPGRGEPGVQGAFSLRLGELGLGGECVIDGEPGPRHPLTIGEPLLLHVQLPVDQGVALRRGVGRIDRNDGVLDAPRRCRCTAGRIRP